jgi:hypothetical protein
MATNRKTNATDVRDSRYVQGGDTDRYPMRLGWWERRLLERSDTDITVTVLASENNRPDLVSNRIYGKSTYVWLVLQYNNIVDVQTEFLTGTELVLPSPRRVALDIINRPVGGKRITNT